MQISCPMCKKVLDSVPDDFEPRPFCSMRCKLADLHSWLSESYRISSPLASSDFGDGDPDEARDAKE